MNRDLSTGNFEAFLRFSQYGINYLSHLTLKYSSYKPQTKAFWTRQVINVDFFFSNLWSGNEIYHYQFPLCMTHTILEKISFSTRLRLDFP